MDKKKFKAVGSNIFKDILDSPAQEPKNLDKEQLRNNGHPDSSNFDSSSREPEKEDIRLHVYISGEIEDKLLDEVFRRKRDKETPSSQASKRAVVEDALMMFLSSTIL